VAAARVPAATTVAKANLTTPTKFLMDSLLINPSCDFQPSAEQYTPAGPCLEAAGISL